MTVRSGDNIIEAANNLNLTAGHSLRHVYNGSQINIGSSTGTNNFLTLGNDSRVFVDKIYTTSTSTNTTGYKTSYLINATTTSIGSNLSTTSTTYSVGSASQMHTYTPLQADSTIHVNVSIACSVTKAGTDNDAQGNFSAVFVDELGAAKSTTKRIGSTTWNEDAYRLVILNSQWTAAIGTNRNNVIYQPIVFVDTFLTSDWINADGTVRIAPYYRRYPDASPGYGATAAILSMYVTWLEYA